MTFEALALFMEKQYKFLTQITLIPGDNIINFRHHGIQALTNNLVNLSRGEDYGILEIAGVANED